MMKIVTHVHLREGAARDWEAAMRTRLSAAKKRPGWVGGQLLRPTDKPDRPVILGTWRTRADWEAWHHDPTFAETRQRLDALESGPAEHWWHDVVLDVRKGAASGSAASRPRSKRATKPKSLRRR
jgi:heme-degrading monooxygenase HmoA